MEQTPEQQLVDEAARQAQAMPPGAGMGQTPQIPPGPLPTNISIGQVETHDGKPVVMLKIDTPQGSSFFFLDPAAARSIGTGLQKAGSVLQSGLVVAGG